jgi:type II secretory pathway component PulK
MQPVLSNVAVLAVTAIFYVWRAHAQVRLRRNQRLRQRVAYMLWVAATGCGESAPQLVEAN